jgi:hypothetical protein
MVICLPILLFLMALMINFGAATTWKIKALLASRHAVWSTRWPRGGARMPRPAYWPDQAKLDASPGKDAPELDDPRVNLPVVRGPLPPGLSVKGHLLDPGRGVRTGTAEVERVFPLLPEIGRYSVKTEQSLLDNKWQYQRMGMSRNLFRRTIVIYRLAQAPQGISNAYVKAALALRQMPRRDDLAPLDRDDEFIKYALQFGFGGPPDFHPRLFGGCYCGWNHRFCSLDHSQANEAALHLIDRIQGRIDREPDGRIVRRVYGVADRMARAFIKLYERVIRALESQLNAFPPLPPGQVSAIQAEISTLKGKIEILRQFETTLRNAVGSPQQDAEVGGGE